MKTYVLLVTALLLLVGAAPALTEAAISITPDKDFDWATLAPKPVQEPLTYTPVEDPGFLDRAASAVARHLVLFSGPAALALAVILWVIRRAIERRRTRRLEARPLGGSMKTPLKIMSAAALLLVVLFLAPVAYQTGQRVGLSLNCSSDYSDNCWAVSGLAILHGGKLPRR